MYRQSDEFSRPAVVEVDEVGRRLLRAAEIIEERGWCKGRLECATGEVCAFGALLKVGDGTDFNAFVRFTDFIHTLGHELLETKSLNTIARWNDHPSRTKEQVIAALRSAAYASAEAREEAAE